MRLGSLLLLPFALGCASLQAAWQGEPDAVATWELRTRAATILILGNDRVLARSVADYLDVALGPDAEIDADMVTRALRAAFAYSTLEPRQQAALDALSLLLVSEAETFARERGLGIDVASPELAVALGWVRGEAARVAKGP